MDNQLRNLGVASNNIHADKPAMMSDGRQGCSWMSESIVDSNMRLNSGINSNWEYRKYLTQNASQIMSQNMQNEMLNNVNNINVSNASNDTVPYTYSGINDTKSVLPSTFSSDLKQIYLTSQQQQAQLYAPNMYSTSH